jgi:periplasmic divalent cation tolerance protein
MKKLRVVLVTCPERDALRLANTLVADELAACVNIVPGVTSVYQWEGEVKEDREALLLVKTTLEALGRLTDAIVEMHSYAVPEVVSLTVRRGEGNAAYLEWLEQSVVDLGLDDGTGPGE